MCSQSYVCRQIILTFEFNFSHFICFLSLCAHACACVYRCVCYVQVCTAHHGAHMEVRGQPEAGGATVVPASDVETPAFALDANRLTDPYPSTHTTPFPEVNTDSQGSHHSTQWGKRLTTGNIPFRSLTPVPWELGWLPSPWDSLPVCNRPRPLSAAG